MNNNSNMPTVAEFVSLETQVWDVLTFGDIEAGIDSLSSEFMGTYPCGFSGRAGQFGPLEQGPAITQYFLDQARLLVIDPNTARLTYRATYLRADSPEMDKPDVMFINSDWSRVDGRWINGSAQEITEA